MVGCVRDAIVYGIELFVGLACVGAGVAVWRRSRYFGAGLMGLGILAIGHALWAWSI